MVRWMPLERPSRRLIAETLKPEVGAEIASALAAKGYKELTAVQRAVLDPELEDRDLRISSQTGSGKTVALGLVLRHALTDGAKTGPGPYAMVVAPTRELARQVESELAWLYAPLHARVVSVTGGASARDERRLLATGPAVIVGTPGRLLDHLTRGAIDASRVQAVVLDEADRLLDMGFRDDLEAILAHAPAERRTHLVSATFPPEVRSLADGVQRDPVHVQGTRLGAANVDIEHVIHLVDRRERVGALVNLLLAWPDAQTLVFARTRADVARLTEELARTGFAVSSLSGEMEQGERNRAMAAFRRGALDALVATDVAARGIDVDIARVIHFEPPDDADAYTHRSGRTGRAGRQGRSALLVAPQALGRTQAILRRANVQARVEPLPAGDAIFERAEASVFEALDRDDEALDASIPQHAWALAGRLLRGHAQRAVARLLVRAHAFGPTPPRAVRVITPPDERPARPASHADPRGRGPRSESRAERDARVFVPFRVTWGSGRGADARRLVALLCRRGNIQSRDIGKIHVERSWSRVEIAADVAAAFTTAVAAPDPRDPNVRVRPESPEPLSAKHRR
jgi:ATP-dependent RNA helicase DeaD